MKELKRKHFRFIKLAENVYAAIAPAEELDITDAGLMDNFSNSGLVLQGGGLVCDTCFDLPHANELKSFCEDAMGHAPEYVVNTHGHWDHFWGNQVFSQARVMGHRDMLKDCGNDKSKVPVFRMLHNAKRAEHILSSLMRTQFKSYLPKEQAFHMVVRQSEHDFDLTGVVPSPPQELFDKKIVLQLGDSTVELIPVGAIHSSSDTVVWLPKERVLFAGDIFADCSLPMDLASAHRWLEVLDYLLDELQPVWIVPGHGELYDLARAQNQREYFRALVSQFERFYTDTISEKELLDKMELTPYLDHRPRLGWVMAVKSFFKEKRKAAKSGK